MAVEVPKSAVLSTFPVKNLPRTSNLPTNHHGAKPQRNNLPSLAAKKYFENFYEMHGKPASVVELGCGAGGVSARLSRLGASVTAFDMVDNLCDAAREACASGKMRFVQKPIQNILWDDLPTEIHSVIAERCLHWINYKAALTVLRKCAQRMRPDAPLHAAIGALTAEQSPLVESYPFDHKTPLTQRHRGMPVAGNSFSNPRTLYTKGEAVSLLSHAGFSPIHIYLTTWGLWKIHAVRDMEPMGRTDKKYPFANTRIISL